MLFLKCVVCTLQTQSQLKKKSWAEICASLDQDHSWQMTLSRTEQENVFRIARHVCRVFRFQNICLTCSLVLIKMAHDGVELYIGFQSQTEAHAWVKAGDTVFTTDRQLPKDASLAYRKISITLS